MNKFSIYKKLFIIIPTLSLLAGYNHASENSLVGRGDFGGGGVRGGVENFDEGEERRGTGDRARWDYNRGYEQGEDVMQEEGYPYYPVAPSDPNYQNPDQNQQDPFFFQ